jgi:hypothetical protein
MLKSGADAHEFTGDERAKGGRVRAEKMRERREAAQAFADEELQAVLGEALHELEELLHADDPHVKLKAAVVILDRTLGRPGQRLEHAGSIEFRRADLVAQAKQELVAEYASQAKLSREKLAAALERRPQRERRRRLTSDGGEGIP